MPRLFVAAWPPPAVVSVLEGMERPDVAGLRWTGPDQWHVTLRFMGSVPDVEPAVGAFDAIEAVAATARMGPATGRFGDRVIHVPVGGLEEVAAAVVAATGAVGEPPDERPFHGHITLARPRGRARVDLRRLTGTPLAAEWPVESVTLVSSSTLAGGARYEVVRRRELYSPGERP
jgi:2'-5' RNA ligase